MFWTSTHGHVTENSSGLCSSRVNHMGFGGVQGQHLVGSKQVGWSWVAGGDRLVFAIANGALYQQQ